jgi:hypothetical protein
MGGAESGLDSAELAVRAMTVNYGWPKKPVVRGKRRRRIVPPKGDQSYRQIWRIVDGALVKTFMAHPEYLPDRISARVIRNSIVKRVTGDVVGWAFASAKAQDRSE